MTIQQRFTLFLTIIFLNMGVFCPSTASELSSVNKLAIDLQTIMEQTAVSDKKIPGVIMHVHAPKLGLIWSKAVGFTDLEGREILTPEHPVRLASNTKTYVAAAILRLWEDGIIDLNSTLRDHLPQEYIQLLIRDGYDPSIITVRHLLTHTSGLFDYAMSETYTNQIINNPMHTWSRIEQLQGAVDWGDPYCAPGKEFHYADTGYILLGLIIEQQTGHNLARSLRELIDFPRLGLNHTWMEMFEPIPPGTMDRAHQFYGDIDIYSYDPSFDSYGGGGLVSTMKDLSIFMRSLFTDDIFHTSKTMDLMLSPALVDTSLTSSNQAPNPYRMGISIVEIAGHKAYTHEGFWGTAAAYFPDLDMSVAVSLNQGQTDQLWHIVERAVAAIVNATKASKQ